MRKIFIVSCYPSTEKQLKILSDCIDILRKTDFKILVVSHKSLSTDIQDKIDYFIYDKDNSFLPKEISPYTYNVNDNFNVRVNYPGHSLCITRNMFNSIKFVNNYEFDFFYFMEFDCLFSDSDLIVVQDLVNQMFEQNKKMIFFKPSEYKAEGSFVYETLFFGGIPSYFLNKFIPPTNLEEWSQLNMRYTLEHTFFEKFCNTEDRYLIINEHSSEYFKDSQINVFRYGSFICEVLYNESNPSNPILYIENHHYNKTNKKVIIRENDVIVESRDCCLGCWYYRGYFLNGMSVSVEIFDEEFNEGIKEFIINENNLINFREKGSITFK